MGIGPGRPQEPARQRRAADRGHRRDDRLQSPGGAGPRAVRSHGPVRQGMGPRRGRRHDDRLQHRRVVRRRAPARRQYSIWVVPMERGPWTFILSTAAEVFHTPYPRGRDALRIPVTPRRGHHMETLAFYFPVVDGDSAVLSLHWGTTVLSIPIKAGSAPR